ncbi:error-prone DNA polymerase [Alteromonas oceanisediminis]|uniref:error-prone DNA polymerase n=1 Tax=Alteromonas oceanisediminis TaxID=2836180 RepID=UPI001BDA9DF9|nr:error-prone DNA polymerase [Alteromonas oceanisediminis]MBT0586732.1 error-prone DNA polymerase [Alteromonas oceanisediminis]
MAAELFCQTNFSFLTGASHPEELIARADFLGYRALAITDECSVAGIVRAYAEKRDKNLAIKLIVGSYFILNTQCKCILLCPNHDAYKELCRIITNARRRADKGDYRLDEWDLKSVRHCLIIWLPDDDHQGQENTAAWLLKHHAERTWIGAQRLLVANEPQRIARLKILAETYQLPMCACTGVLMHEVERQPLQHVLTATRLGRPVADLGREALSNTERSLRSPDKLAKLYPQEWLTQAEHIAERCHFCLSSLQYQYPSELIPKGFDATSYLRLCVERGIKKRFVNGLPNDIRALIEKELKLIQEQRYEYFFLTIYDVVQFAKSQAILYQGRGSAANSVVCYCLEITAVDPRQINVLFERFISKERNEPPDIDVDFEHERREEVIQYIYRKYGRERTALAATVVCYRFKSALREVGKALGINRAQLDFFISNVNRRDRDVSWQSQLGELGLDPDSRISQHLVALVNELMGFPRHLSQHVGGFVISAGPLYELVPVENASMAQRTVIQWDKDDLEALGLLKVDVLALGMLTAIRKCFDVLSLHYDHHTSIADITRLGDDPQVYQMLQKGDSVGVFQVESRAQMTMLPRLKPACYYDLVVQIAIVRPGPIQGDMVHPYLRRRDGREAIDYPSEEVKSVLSRTMGVPIFQEQVIQLAMVAAGFSGGEADQLRRAMASWKKNGKLVQFRDKLKRGMQKKGYQDDFAERLYQQILGFGVYGFPESHSASFAVLAYVSSWLKCYYPAAFYASLLNSLPMGFYSASQLIQDAQRHAIEIRPVCINASLLDHHLQPNKKGFAIRLGLRLVKGLSQATAVRLVQQRPTQGYASIADVKQLGIHSLELQALASADAFKGIAGNRYQARWQIMETVSQLPLMQGERDPHQLSLVPTEVDDLVEDYRAVGVSLNQHPVALLLNANKLPRFTFASDLVHQAHKSVVSVIGCVTGRQAPGTASGVTFMTLEDHTGNTNVVVWQATARAQKQTYLKSTILQVNGILERGDGDVIHVIAGRLTDLTGLLSELDLKARHFY